MAQWLKILTTLLVNCSAPILDGSLMPLTPAPGDPIPLYPWAPEQKAQMAHAHIHTPPPPHTHTKGERE